MRVYSIFASIDGEVNSWGQGHLTIFIRFSGCPLKCSYCDTQYAQSIESGTEMSVAQIMERIKEIGLDKVTITGGEPLMQRSGLIDLLIELTREGYKVSIETNGAYDIPVQYQADSWVIDWKLSNSGMDGHMKDDHFLCLVEKDFIKFVIGSYSDYREAHLVMKRLKGKGCRARFAFSPMFGTFDPFRLEWTQRLIIDDLVKWLIEDKVEGAIVNLQLHKLVNLREEK